MIKKVNWADLIFLPIFKGNIFHVKFSEFLYFKKMHILWILFLNQAQILKNF